MWRRIDIVWTDVSEERIAVKTSNLTSQMANDGLMSRNML
jgi:hypothetical protein